MFRFVNNKGRANKQCVFADNKYRPKSLIFALYH